MATPNMNLDKPTVGGDSGAWGGKLNADLDLLDAHDHSATKGVKVTPAGFNVNQDLEFNNNDATELRSANLQDQVSALSAVADRGSLHRAGDDLFYLDGSGNSVRLTQSGQAATGAAGAQVGYARATTGALISSTATIPKDDTIPTATEGVEIVTVVYAPKKIGNKILVRAIVPFGINTGTDARTSVAAFINKDSGAALAVVTSGLERDVGVSNLGHVAVVAEETVASLAAATWRLRAGWLSGNAGDTIDYNGNNGARLFGGVSGACIEVVEISQ